MLQIYDDVNKNESFDEFKILPIDDLILLHHCLQADILTN